jgi:hypothetical protein
MNKPQLYILCNSGLANRLHAMAGAQFIAKATGRDLKVWWPCNRHLNSRFSRLFTNHFDFVKQEEIEQLLTTENRVKIYNCGYNAWNTEVHECYGVGHYDDEEIVVIKTWWVPKFCDMPQAKLHPHIVRFVRELEPVQEVRAITTTTADFNEPRSPVVGLHIRYGDKLPDDQSKWDESITRLYAKSGIEAFERLMDRIIAVKPQVHFFVASINHEIEYRLRDKYGGGLITFQPKDASSRNSVVGMRQAVADLYTLSRCKFVIGSDYSQYSMLASEIGCVPLIRAGTADCGELLEAQIKKL